MEYGVKTTWDGQLRAITNTFDRSMISIWLGHESIETTQIYLNANLVMKDEILAKKDPVKVLRAVTDPEIDYSTSSQACEEEL